MPDTTLRPAAGSPPPDDQAELDKKNKELDTVNAEFHDAAARVATLTAEVKILEARIADAKKAIDAYGAGSPSQQKELDDDLKLIAQKWAMASAAVKNQKDAIDKIVKSVDDDIAAQSAKVDGLQKAVDKASQEYATAAADWKVKSDAYAAIKQTQKTTDDQLKQIKALIDQAAKAETQDDVVAMYFLLEEALTAAKAVTIISADEYAAKLKAAQADAESSKATSAAEKSELDAFSKQYADAQTQLAAAIAARRSTILTKLKEIKTGSAAAAPAPAAAPGAAATTGLMGSTR